MSKMNKITKIVIFLLITSIVSATSSYTATNYAISANSVGYSDNSNLGATNVQAAIDGTCTKFSTQLTEMRKSMYPVGSIYISTTLSTTTQVANAIGGTWQFFGDGKVLRSSSGTPEQTGGSSTVTLTTSNLPNHSHSYTPSGTNSYTTKDVSTGNNSANPIVSFANGGEAIVVGTYTASSAVPTARGFISDVSTGWWSNTNKGSSSISVSGSHTHSISESSLKDAMGTISFSGQSASTTGCDNCSASSFSTIDPYITVYMYKRIS